MTELLCRRLNRLEAQLTETRDSLLAIVNWLHQNYNISIPGHILKFKVVDEPPPADHPSDSISMVIDSQNESFTDYQMFDIDEQNQFTDFVDDLMDIESGIEDKLIEVNKCKPCSVFLTRIDDPSTLQFDQKPIVFDFENKSEDVNVRLKALDILNSFSYLTWPPGQSIACPYPSCPRVITYIKSSMKTRFKKHLINLHGFEFPISTSIKTLRKIHKLDKFKVTEDLKQKSINLYHTLYHPYKDKAGQPVLRNAPQLDCPICGLQICALSSAGHDLLKQRFKEHLKLTHKIIVRAPVKQVETIEITTTTPETPSNSNYGQKRLNQQYVQKSQFKNNRVCEFRCKALEILNGFSYLTWPPGQSITCPYPSCQRVVPWTKNNLKITFKKHLINIHGFKFPTCPTIKSLNKIHKLDKCEVTEDLKQKSIDLYQTLYHTNPFKDQAGVPLLRNPPQINCPICGLEICALSSTGHDLLKQRFGRHLKFFHNIFVVVAAASKKFEIKNQSSPQSQEAEVRAGTGLNQVQVKRKKKWGLDEKVPLYYKEIVRKRYHEMAKTHLCSVCGAAFKLPSQLRYHAMTHSEDSPYACDLCDRRFKQPQALCNHKRVSHDPDRNEKTVCYKCGGIFAKKGISTHLREVHAEGRRFSCQVEGCSSKFKSSSHLGSHERSVHKRKRKKT